MSTLGGVDYVPSVTIDPSGSDGVKDGFAIRDCKTGTGKGREPASTSAERLTKTPGVGRNDTPSRDKIDVVVVGGGPVGLYFSKELKRRRPSLEILILEKYSTYSRHHYVKVETHYLNVAGASHLFFKLASSVTPLAHSSVISRTETISIMELEGMWKREALAAGIHLQLDSTVTDPCGLELVYPNAHLFVGADGARSVVRKQIFGDTRSIDRELQYMVELKYSVDSDVAVRRLDKNDLLKTKKVLHFSLSEFVRNTDEVIVRFLVDKKTYEHLGSCTFKSPLFLYRQFNQLPPKLKHDIVFVLNIRQHVFGESIREESATVAKTALGVYKAARVAAGPGTKLTATEPALSNTATDADANAAKGTAVTPESAVVVVGGEKAAVGKEVTLRAFWFLIGDAAMGVPFFRSLNAGLECAGKLVDQLTDVTVKLLGTTAALRLVLTRYSTFYSLISFRENNEAVAKSNGLKMMSMTNVFAGASPVQIHKWSANKIKKFEVLPPWLALADAKESKKP